MSNKTQPLPTFTANFSGMNAMPSWYQGGTVVRHPRTAASQASTSVLPVVR
jgi:hypothetical protein